MSVAIMSVAIDWLCAAMSLYGGFAMFVVVWRSSCKQTQSAPLTNLIYIRAMIRVIRVITLNLLYPLCLNNEDEQENLKGSSDL